ncbi:MAG: sulfatase, partial [Cyclobacteriaceae bacterium]
QRAIRTKDFLLIWNAYPERWPAGAPQRIKDETTGELYPVLGIDSLGIHHSEWAFTDIDEILTKNYIVEGHSSAKVSPYFEMAVAKRPEFELYNIQTDPDCLSNLSGLPKYSEMENMLKSSLFEKLISTRDARVSGKDPEVFDSYLRYGKIRKFPAPGLKYESL